MKLRNRVALGFRDASERRRAIADPSPYIEFCRVVPLGSMAQGQSQPPQGAVENRRQMPILHLAMVGLFLLDLALPRNIPLLPYYFLLVVLSATFAAPRPMLPLIVQAYGLAIISGLYWGFLPSIDYLTRLLALTGLVVVALWLSAQREREQALRRRSEQILNLALNNTAAGVGLADARGHLFRVNSALCTMLGCDAETLLRRSWPDITHPDDMAQEQPLMEEMLANRRDSYRLKKRVLRGDGSSIWMDMSISCARTPDGRLEFLIAQGIDISQEVENQQAQSRSQDMLRRTLEQCNVGLALCSPGTGAILQANSRLRSVLGLAPAVLREGSLAQVFRALERVPVDDSEAGAPMDHAALEALLRGENDVYRVRVRFQRADGQRGWGNLLLSNLRDATGSVMHVLLELDDITDVVAQTEYLQTAAAAGVVGIWDWDPVRDVLTWDPVMYRLYGVQPDQFSGAVEAWAQSVHPDDRPFVEAELQAALKGEREYAPRFRVLWPDGSVRHIQAASRAFFDGQGHAVRILGVNYDVTELVQTQQQLQTEQLRLSTTLDALLDPHLLLAPVRDHAGSIVDLRILRANPAAVADSHLGLQECMEDGIRRSWSGQVSGDLFARCVEVLSSGDSLVLDNFPFHHAQQGGLHYIDIRAVKVGEELSITWRDVSERIALEQALQHRATTDSLTTLLNREEIFAQIERLLAHDRRRDEKLAVLFCDLDRFKAVNDTYGHQAGDAVLQAMAARILSCLRVSDLAARIGGDELMVVLPGVERLQDAVAIAEKVRGLAREPVPIPQGQVQITLSVGVALACPGESLDALIARADTAMYAAKEHGRDQVVAIDVGSPGAGNDLST